MFAFNKEGHRGGWNPEIDKRPLLKLLNEEESHEISQEGKELLRTVSDIMRHGNPIFQQRAIILLALATSVAPAAREHAGLEDVFLTRYLTFFEAPEDETYDVNDRHRETLLYKQLEEPYFLGNSGILPARIANILLFNDRSHDYPEIQRKLRQFLMANGINYWLSSDEIANEPHLIRAIEQAKETDREAARWHEGIIDIGNQQIEIYQGRALDLLNWDNFRKKHPHSDTVFYLSDSSAKFPNGIDAHQLGLQKKDYGKAKFYIEQFGKAILEQSEAMGGHIKEISKRRGFTEPHYRIELRPPKPLSLFPINIGDIFPEDLQTILIGTPADVKNSSFHYGNFKSPDETIAEYTEILMTVFNYAYTTGIDRIAMDSFGIGVPDKYFFLALHSVIHFFKDNIGETPPLAIETYQFPLPNFEEMKGILEQRNARWNLQNMGIGL